MSNLIEVLVTVSKYEMKLDWTWINDGSFGYQKAINERFIELVPQPYDKWRSARYYFKLTEKGKTALTLIYKSQESGSKMLLEE